MGILRILAVVLVLSRVALAQPAAPNEKQRTQAGELVKKAIAKSQAGDNGLAIDLYLQAYTIAPLPILLSNIASEYQQENKPVEALKYFCWYLKDDPAGANVSYATANAKSLQIQLGREVDDKDVCKPIEKKVEPPPPPNPPPTPPPGPDTTVTGTAGTITTTAPQPAESHGRSKLQYAGLGIGGAGVIALGVGIVYGVKGYQLSNKISDHPMTAMWESTINAEEVEGNDDNTKQEIFMIAGGAAIAAGAVMYWIGRDKPENTEHAHLVPVASPSSVGFALAGGF